MIRAIRILFRLLFLGAVATLPMGCGGPEQDFAEAIPARPDFTFDVKPLLSDRCFACHGPDESKQKASLALHVPERAFAELAGKPGKFAIVPGKPEESALYRRIMSKNDELVMPPPESHLSLTEAEKELLRRWIEQGAEYKDHWAFSPPQDARPPDVRKDSWVRNPVDNFVLAKLEDKGLSPTREADRPTLLRRVTYDLTGLPPTPEELDAFVNDDAPDAYEKVVDRLLASPHYGERMATDWLDLSRYADSHGYQDDRPRTSWPWRDWVIRAFNSNLNYQDFITWQLAGDLLPEPTYEQLLATGFNRNHSITQEGGIIEAEYLAEYASDRTHVFGTAFLGLTVECAKCHTHKYDPILHEDYYQLTAFFNNIEEKGHISLYDEAPEPRMPIQDPALEQEISAINGYIQRLEATQRELEQSGLLTDTESLREDRETLLKKDLVAHYDFEQNEENRTLSALPDGEAGWMNYNLPPTFGAVEVSTGKAGSALRFDGENYVSLGNTGDFNHHQAFSASLWIKHDGRRGKMRALFGKRMDELRHNGYDLVLTTDNRLAFRLAGFWWGPDAYPEGLEAIEVRTRSSVPAGSWQHVAVTYDGSGKADGIQLYLGGGAQVQRTVVDNLNDHTLLHGNHLSLGNWNQRGRIKGKLGGFAGGSIDEFRLYARELSPIDVALLTSPAHFDKLSASPVAARSKAEVRKHALLHYDATYRHNIALLDSLRAIDRKLPGVMIMRERDTVAVTHVRLRGEYDQHGPVVQRKAPSALPALPANAPPNRLGLAQWLFASEHPLTARVAVNRLWQQCFGRGIVGSAADFGNQGDLPTHPELLDYLSLHYREIGWDTKAMLRLFLTSATYRQDARTNDALRERDPENHWLARGPAVKLTAEMIRDQALATSGLLHGKIGGKWVKPYQPAGLWKEMASDIGEPIYRPSQGQALFRRSLYTYFKRTIPPPDLLTLDAAERNVCTVTRQKTSTPLQSLILLNAPLYTEAARHLATNELRAGRTEKALVTSAFRRILSREPEEEETSLLQKMLQKNTTYFQSDPAAAEELLAVGTTAIDPTLDREQLAASTMLVTALFNLDEAQRK